MLVLKCVVLLTAITLIHGEELTNECRCETLIISYQVDDCIAKLQTTIPYVDQLLEEFNQTVVYYTGDEVDYQSIDPLINQLFNILPKFCDCIMLGFDVPAACPHDVEHTLRKLYYEQVAEFAYHAQENNGESVKKLIPHNGLKVLLSNREIDRCVDIIKDIRNMEELCSAIGRAHQCAVQVIGDHPNENVLTTVHDIATRMKQADYC